MIALAEDRTLYRVLPACQEKRSLGVQIVEYSTELRNLRPVRDARREKSTEKEPEIVTEVAVELALTPRIVLTQS
jgi:hypothetical protein